MELTVLAWLVIVGAGIATYAIRGSFLLFASRMEALPTWVMEVLRMIPAAALAALVAPAVLRPEDELVWIGPRPAAALIAMVVAWRTRSVLWTILTGLAAVVALELLVA